MIRKVRAMALSPAEAVSSEPRTWGFLVSWDCQLQAESSFSTLLVQGLGPLEFMSLLLEVPEKEVTCTNIQDICSISPQLQVPWAHGLPSESLR